MVKICQVGNKLKLFAILVFWTGASFQLFLGGQIFLNFSMPPDYWKIGKKHFICSNSTLFIVSFFFLFILSFLIFLFIIFVYPWGRRPPSPPQMTPLILNNLLFKQIMSSYLSKNLVYCARFLIAVAMAMVWKSFRSIIHILQAVSAVKNIDTVEWQRVSFPFGQFPIWIKQEIEAFRYLPAPYNFPVLSLKSS